MYKQRLFSVGKVGLFLDDYAPSTETRNGDTVKILTLALRVEPFDHKFAAAIDDGLGGDSNVRRSLFKLSGDGDPIPHIRRINFALDCPLQNLHIYAAPDTEESRLMLPQCKIANVYARTKKNANSLVLRFDASFGPVDRDKHEFVHQWLLNQSFVTFEQAEPFMEESEPEEAEAAPKRRGRPRRAAEESADASEGDEATA
jgi:hypothetical protein